MAMCALDVPKFQGTVIDAEWEDVTDRKALPAPLPVSDTEAARAQVMWEATEELAKP